MLPLLLFRSPSRLSFLGARTSLRTSLVRLDRFYHQPAHAILLCQCFTLTGGTGISTSCPSPTTFVLGLGPDLPWVDEPSPARLHLVTHTGILSPAPSTVSSDSASASARCSSTARCHLHRLQGLAFSLFSSCGTLFSLPYWSCSTDVFLPRSFGGVF